MLDGIALDTLKADAQYEGVVVSIPAATVVTGSDGACTEFCNFTIGTSGNVTFAVTGDPVTPATGTTRTRLFASTHAAAVLLVPTPPPAL